MTLIAAAQSCAHPADLPRNLDDHLRLMRIAQARGVRLLVFPELSLTGYEPSAAAA
ncbi:carbon-nitrogen hydrolase family protein, partial [Pseudomonas aeruginosa]|nr:carbon-nitrogen hydrolase family protein [Pseudomonas aeruginosa]